MSILQGLLGNASEVNTAELEKSLHNVLINEEKVQKAFIVLRDYFVFTNRRMILVDKQGLTGVKINYQSIPYRSIDRFSVETAGSFDMDAELKIWIKSSQEPIKKEFKKGTDIVGLQKVLAEQVLK